MDNPQTHITRIHSILSVVYPESRVLLEYASPFQLLIGVILSAQTTDRQVNQVTPELFTRFPSPRDLGDARQEDVEGIIRSTGFFKMKARHIIRASKLLARDYEGKVPDNMDDLLTLSGVGRKSANVVLAHCFNKPAVIVDTHFKRVTRRLGLTSENDPVKIEKELSALIPPDIQTDLSMYLNYLGRDWCFARKPDCNNCPLKDICPSASTET